MIHLSFVEHLVSISSWYNFLLGYLCRGISTAHAIVVAIASFYLIVLSDLFKEDYGDGLIVNRSSTLSNTVMGVSVM